MRYCVEGAAKSLHLPRLHALQTIPVGVSVEGDFDQSQPVSTLPDAYMYFVGCLPSAALWVIECRCMREGREVGVWGPAGEPQQGCRN